MTTSGVAQPRTSPFVWLGGLLAAYLAIPVITFAVRLGTSHQRGFGTPGLWGALRTSVESATIAVAIGALLGIPLAYGLAHHRGRIASLLGVAVQLPIALPPVMAGVLLIYILGPYTTLGRWFDGRLTQSVAGVVAAQVFVSTPFLVVAARSSFMAVDQSLADLAATLGRGPLARFFLVDLVVAAPGLRAGLLLMWLRAIGEYGANVVVAYHPFTLSVFTFVQFSGGGIPETQAPTLLVLGAAAVAVGVTYLRRPAVLRRAPVIPEPRGPAVAGAANPVSANPVSANPVSFDLDVNVGEFHLRVGHVATSHRLAIVGPSGSGKSMTLRSLAGLLGPRVGRVQIGGTDVTGVPAERRLVGYVPQGQGLFPTLTVWKQMTFSPFADPALAAWWMGTMGLDGLAARRPSELSGGQRQRVSLATALSRRPRVLLLDEPFSALDVPVRRELRMELRRLQMEAGLSSVLVTHDPEEAALLADEVLVMSAGCLLQTGPVAEVYRRPASPEVARLLGIDNVLAATVESPVSVAVGGGPVVSVAGDQLDSMAPGTPVLWRVVPERLLVRADDGSSHLGCHKAQLVDVADLGTTTLSLLRLPGGVELRARSEGMPPVGVGEACLVEIPPDAVTVWPARPGD